MFDLSWGTLWLMLLCIVISIMYRGYVTPFFEKSDRKRVDSIFFAAISVRVIWYLIYFAFIVDSYPFMITDDYNYYFRAVAASASPSLGRNSYQIFLNYLYLFWGASSFNGRLVNFFASVLCVYPIAYIDRAINYQSSKFTATKMYCCFPFMITICSFEIKDILSMFFFTTSCMILMGLQREKKNRIISFVFFCIMSELVRSGMGLLVLGVYGCIIFHQKLGGTSAHKGKKTFAYVCVITLILVMVVVLMSTEYYSDTMSLLGQYTAGRDKSISSGSLFDFLTIHNINEIWKLPLDLLFYIMLPNSSEHVGRFMLDFGVYFRWFDVPVTILGVYWMIRKCKKFGLYSLCVIVPYVYLACFQIITFREVIFIVPLIYIFAVNYLCPEDDQGSHTLTMVKLGSRKVNYRAAILIAMYCVWFAFVLLRV